MQACAAHGVQAVLTRDDHVSGSDRLAEACALLGLDGDDLVVNVQGDEPLIPPAVINQVAANLAQRPDVGICTLYAPIHEEAEFRNPNAVKLVTNAAGAVLYFSRAPIPWPRDGHQEAAPWGKRHIGLYAYRVQVLQDFVLWPVGELESLEKLEQLRAMHQGVALHAELCCESIHTIARHGRSVMTTPALLCARVSIRRNHPLQERTADAGFVCSPAAANHR
jgi:3-deoxy-manno-octulosonate cytidylyltransferase (CMP-KDO synthetase)